MRIKLVDLAREQERIGSELHEAIDRVLHRHLYVLGPELEAFEEEFAAYCGVDHCVGVASGTDALYLALRAGGVGPGAEVLTVSHTFAATAIAVRMAGATPLFVDVDRDSWTMAPSAARSALSPRTRALLPVHLYGQCADMAALLELAGQAQLLVVEDACQAHGASLDGRRAGSLGAMGCFSFYPSKNLGALGDGGAVVTNDAGLADELRLLRNYGQRTKYLHESFGINSRLDELQAAVLRVRLVYLETFNEHRRELARLYRRLLSDLGVVCQREPAGGLHAYHLFVIQVANRDQVREGLFARGIETGVHYPTPVHIQPMFARSAHAGLLVTEHLAAGCLSLPMHSQLREEEVREVVQALAEVLAGAK